jgi:CheY-like chemotaxis protein
MKTQPFVLVCDDNRASADCIVFYLRKAGYQAQAVSSPSDCREAAQRNRPDLVLMDAKNTRLDEKTVSRLVNAVPGADEIPVVFLSGQLSGAMAS